MSSLIIHRRVDDLVRRQRQTKPLIRQVVSIVALSPDKERICLGMSEKAVKDERYNLTPPQGEIEVGETVSVAGARELDEELGQLVNPRHVIYLGSMQRQLPEGHKHQPRFNTAHHHWVGVVLSSNKLTRQPPFSVVDWYQLSSLEEKISLPMSSEKKQMCSAVIARLKVLIQNLPIPSQKVLALSA